MSLIVPSPNTKIPLARNNREGLPRLGPLCQGRCQSRSARSTMPTQRLVGDSRKVRRRPSNEEQPPVGEARDTQASCKFQAPLDLQKIREVEIGQVQHNY